jgi:hypothetical protein
MNTLTLKPCYSSPRNEGLLLEKKTFIALRFCFTNLSHDSDLRFKTCNMKDYITFIGIKVYILFDDVHYVNNTRFYTAR